jgi:hypothetical protein
MKAKVTPETKPVEKTKRKMRPGGGKAKGSNFEGKIAKALSAALPLTFIRSPGSGARVGGQNFEKFGAMFGADAMKLFVADVVPTNERDTGFSFKWSVECKFYATVDTFNHLFAGTSNIYKWFEESVTDSAKVGKKPILIWKWNHSPIYVAIEDTGEFDIQPQFKIHQAQSPRPLAIYAFDELLKNPDFWVEKFE